MGRVEGKVAIITGAASGFGEATTRLLAAEGAKVVATDKTFNDADGGPADVGNGIAQMYHDVTREEDWKRVVDATMKLHGRIDILMNNAGVYGSGKPQDIETITLKEWRFVNDVNMDGVFLGCHIAIPEMAKSGGGSIINISSIAGIRGTAHSVAYGASKGAVRQFTKSIAQHCGRKGYRIRCNSIHPGMVRTPLGEDALRMGWGDVEKGAEERVKGVPLGELGTVEDIAYAVLFLASDESRHITATEVVIDGGLTGAG
jgi:NAD(P)-dependent dehydrogenase (short-subunit alcohol dehydrogenase family)